jgi:hypothetical protein
MLFLSVWFLTDGWNGRLRLIAFPLALFFLPVLGALSVGQYDFPVLLGTSLLIYSLRRENVALTMLGAVLLTFKPHIGALILLSALGWLIIKKSNFGRRAMRSIVVAGRSFHSQPDRGPVVVRQLSNNAFELSGRGQCDGLLRMRKRPRLDLALAVRRFAGKSRPDRSIFIDRSDDRALVDPKVLLRSPELSDRIGIAGHLARQPVSVQL